MNKANINWAVFASIVSIALLFGCHPDDGSSLSLGGLPKAQFQFTVNANGHSVVAVSKTKGPVMVYWSVPSLNLGYGDLKGDSAKLNFIFPGTYKITLLVDGHGGTDTLSQFVTTTQPDPNACLHSKLRGFLASCTQKTWRMNPDTSAFWVSQYAGGVNSWWKNGTQEVTDRACAFNDEWTFKFNSAGDLIFNDKGDFFGDGYLGNNSTTCQPTSNYTTAQAPWGSGNFKYALIEGAGIKKLGQLKLIGLGAHFGIQKAINNNETPNGATATSVTYDIIGMRTVTDNSGTYDLLIVTMHYGSWSPTDGWWTFTLRSF